MAYRRAREIDIDDIPVIDVAPIFEGPGGERAVGRQLLDTVQRIGFFYIDNHGVPRHEIDGVFDAAEKFFHASPAQKETVRIQDYHRGFLPIGEATMAGASKPDYKESFVWGWPVDAGDPDIERSRHILAPNRWPEFMPELAGVLTRYIETVNDLGVGLLRAFAAGLDLEHDHFTRHFDKPLTRAALVYYLPLAGQDLAEARFGVSPHTDYGCVTLLYQDGAGGLEVKDRNGDWLTAHPIEGTFVVNVGDLLHRWSNDRFISNPHRVVNASGRERISIPVFVDPNWDTLVEPVVEAGGATRYEAIRCADYIRGVYERSFAYRKSDD
jgi:isopenicillin N synthase-like dioxygenase